MRRLAAAVVLLATSHAHAADLHVGAGQTYATVQEAVDAAMPGDNVLLHAGDHDGDVRTNTDGTEAMRITITSAGDGPASIRGRVRLDADYWRIVDLPVVSPPGTDGISIEGSFNQLLRIELSGGDRDGVDGAGVGNEILDSHIHDFDAGDSDAHCIVLNPGAERWVIRGNELVDCSGDGIQLFSSGAERSIIDTRIESNHIHFTGGTSRTENAIDVKNADGLVIFGNLMHGFADNKVVVFQKAPTRIDMQCNVMRDGFTGVEFRGEDGGVVEDVTFARNLMHDFASYALKFDDVRDAVVFNNTFADIANDGLRIEEQGLDGGRLHNNLWVRTGDIEGGAALSATTSHNGFFMVGDIAIASAQDVNADPLLDADRRIAETSPMVDAGLDVGMPFAGVAPDIGHHELALDESCGAPPPGAGGGGAGASGGGSASAAGTSTTVGTGGGAANPPVAESGCSCQIVAPANDTGWWLVLAISIWGWRRRSSRSTR